MIVSFGIGKSTLDRTLKKLKEVEVIERVGSKKTGYWKVLVEQRTGNRNKVIGQEITDESLIKDIKDKIYERQYEVLKHINSQTIKLYWEIGEEIYKQQQEKSWGKSVVNAQFLLGI